MIVAMFSVEDIVVMIERDSRGFHAYSRQMKGLHTCGDTLQEAVDNAKDAVAAYKEALSKWPNVAEAK